MKTQTIFLYTICLLFFVVTSNLFGATCGGTQQYTCPNGGTIKSGTTSTCTYAATGGVTQTNPFCPTSTPAASFDATVDKCQAPYTNTCPTGGTVNTTVGACTDARINNCATGYSYQGVPVEKCEAIPTCPTVGYGVATPSMYNTTTNKCEWNEYHCPLGESYTCNKSTTQSNAYYCSNVPCADPHDSSNSSNEDTTQGANDKRANGTVNSGGCQGNIYIFNGKDMRCRTMDAFGLAGSCCNASSVLLGLIPCKEDEKNWAKLTQDGKCHYVGEYCSKKFLGVCMTRKQSHCCFNGKLARIIQEQGREQLNMSWGTAKAPQCQGFKPEQFQKIDFSKMDLSEFVGDIESKSQAVLNSGAIQNKINTSIQAVTGQPH